MWAGRGCASRLPAVFDDFQKRRELTELTRCPIGQQARGRPKPNNHRRTSDAELKPFKTRRLSVSCYARTEHIGKEPRLSPAPCHPEQLRPIPPRARLLLRKCRQAHSTTEQHTAHALDLAGREDSGHAYTLARVPSALQLARRKRVPSTRRVSRSCSHATSAPSSRRLRTHPYSS